MSETAKDNAAAQQATVANEQTVERLAQISACIAKDEVAKMFGADLGAALLKAREVVASREAAVAAAASVPLGRTGLPVLDAEQSAEYIRCAFMRMLGRPMHAPNPKLDSDGRITQALTSSTDSAGGYLVPDDFIAELEKRAAQQVTVWPLLRKRPTSRLTVVKPEVTTYITVNKGTSANMNSATTATEITVTEPVFDTITWTMRDFDARMPLKLDLIDESPLNVYQELIDLAADGFAIEREREPLIGTGSANSRPTGLLDSSAAITTFATSGADTVTEIMSSISQLPVRYRRNATILMSTQTIYHVAATLAENVRDAGFLAGLMPPLKESEYVTDGKLLIGDFNYYVVYYRYLMQVITSIAAERKTQEVVVTEKWDGLPTITDAFRIGTGVTYA